MSRKKRYRYNKETLSYEPYKTPFSKSILRSSGLFILSVGAFFCYLYIYTEVLGLEAPKSQMLRRQNADWISKLEILNKKFDSFESKLTEFQLRDDVVYRSIFGMQEIPQDIRNAGFGGVDRYSHLEMLDYSGTLTKTVQRLDVLQKKAYIQSKSLDEVSLLSKRTEDMAQCVPSISPVLPDWKRRIRITSVFGMRLDPISRTGYRQHKGLDFGGPLGEPIYVTGDGVVESVRYELRGFGHYVTVNHGFGYITRYAHLRATKVIRGQKVTRGELIGEMGSSGRSTGTHLHYEIKYRGKHVNPTNYYNSKVLPEAYADIINKSNNSNPSV